MNDIKDYHESLALWQDFVMQGDLIYPNENVTRFIFKNKFKRFFITEFLFIKILPYIFYNYIKENV